MISLNRTQAIECFLSGKATGPERLLHRAKMLLDPELQRDTDVQRTVYEMVNVYGRKQLRNNIKVIESRLFSDPAYSHFQQQVKQIFK